MEKLFEALFRSERAKEMTLELYNATNGSQYISAFGIELYEKNGFHYMKYQNDAFYMIEAPLFDKQYGKNQQIYKDCKFLNEYWWLCEAINQKNVTMTEGEAVENAISEMPDSFGIKDFVIFAHKTLEII